MDKCEHCGSELECLGGQPAHKSNWVCTNGWCKKPTVIRGEEVKSSSAPASYDALSQKEFYELVRDIASEFVVDNFGVCNKSWAEVVFDQWAKEKEKEKAAS